MSTLEKTIDLLHALPDTGKTPEEYKGERIRERVRGCFAACSDAGRLD